MKKLHNPGIFPLLGRFCTFCPLGAPPRPNPPGDNGFLVLLGPVGTRSGVFGTETHFLAKSATRRPKMQKNAFLHFLHQNPHMGGQGPQKAKNTIGSIDSWRGGGADARRIGFVRCIFSTGGRGAKKGSAEHEIPRLGECSKRRWHRKRRNHYPSGGFLIPQEFQ